MATAPELLALSGALTDSAESLLDRAEAEQVANGGLPSGETDRLNALAESLTTQANNINQAVIPVLAADISSAVTGLNFQVSQADNAIKSIATVQKVLDVASALLVAAASIAVSVGTGNFVGTASAVITLANSLHATLGP